MGWSELGCRVGWKTPAMHSATTVHYRNTDLELNRTIFRVMKSTKKSTKPKCLSYVKDTVCSKLRSKKNCKPVKKKQGLKVC